MTNEEKAKEIALMIMPDCLAKDDDDYGELIQHDCYIAALDMAEWKDEQSQNAFTNELILEICESVSAFEKIAKWNNASWCEHAENDDWEGEYYRRVKYVKKRCNLK